MPVSPYIKRLRKAVGHDLILMPGATALVLDQRGWILLQRRADDGTWAPPGGFMEPGESIRMTVVREVCEETGLRVRIRGVIGIYSSPEYIHVYPNRDKVHPVILAFRCSVVGGKLEPQDGEATVAEFVAPSQLSQRRMHPYYRRVIRDLSAKKTFQVD